MLDKCNYKLTFRYVFQEQQQFGKILKRIKKMINSIFIKLKEYIKIIIIFTQIALYLYKEANRIGKIN